MGGTHFIGWTRDDEAETDITVEYTISGGCAAHYGSLTYPGHPAEAPEVEITEAYSCRKPPAGEFITKDTPRITLTDAEEQKCRDWIIENHEEDEPDEY